MTVQESLTEIEKILDVLEISADAKENLLSSVRKTNDEKKAEKVLQVVRLLMQKVYEERKQIVLDISKIENQVNEVKSKTEEGWELEKLEEELQFPK